MFWQLHNVICVSLHFRNIEMSTGLLLTKVLQEPASSGSTVHLSTVWPMVQCPSFYPRHDSSWPCADSRAGTRKCTVSLLWIRRAVGTIAAPLFNALILHSQAQSFLVLLALAMFSCRFCFFFCSRSRASIILASFQDSSALAMKRGVRASMTVVRKP